VLIYQTTQHHIPADQTFDRHRCENLTYYSSKTFHENKKLQEKIPERPKLHTGNEYRTVSCLLQ
jgi:hypothetical protein